jgi:hypothetical protein
VFNKALECWGSDEFPQKFKQAIKSLELGVLPLVDCCNHSAVIDQDTIEPIILSSSETSTKIKIKMGVFFCEVLSGCACSDDPSQAKILENSYCELLVEIDRANAQVEFTSASSVS